MGYLYQVVQFYTSSYYSAAHGRAVYTGIGAYLHIVLKHHIAYLWYLVIAVGLGVRGKPEAVGTYYTSGVYGIVVAQLAVVVDGYIGIYDAVLAQYHVVAYRCVGIYLTAIAYHGVLADIGKGSDELFFVHKVHFRLLEPLPSVGLYIFVFCPVHI